ncbi:MAG TPA: biotin/lipoyl-binding protein, partial [Rhodocyclaceae bacterium]|nr:biotin/lipoyl-binding protein [Rhodocyclaceae bacterium]
MVSVTAFGRIRARASRPARCGNGALTGFEYKRMLIFMKKIARLPLAVLTAVTVLTATPILADVPTVRVEARATPAALAAEATVEAVRQVTVAARVPGRIVALAVDAGDAVAHGDELVRIDAAEAEQAL